MSEEAYPVARLLGEIESHIAGCERAAPMLREGEPRAKMRGKAWGLETAKLLLLRFRAPLGEPAGDPLAGVADAVLFEALDAAVFAVNAPGGLATVIDVPKFRAELARRLQG